MHDVYKLELATKRTVEAQNLNEEYGWYNPALDVIDCVLSLNRKYKAFVLPRVYAFQEKHPGIINILQLRELIASYPTPLEFSINELNYNDAGRAQILIGVVEYLL
jgi:hypothetical protein